MFLTLSSGVISAMLLKIKKSKKTLHLYKNPLVFQGDFYNEEVLFEEDIQVDGIIRTYSRAKVRKIVTSPYILIIGAPPEGLELLPHIIGLLPHCPPAPLGRASGIPPPSLIIASISS